MNFKVVEREPLDVEAIHDSFVQDYLFSNDLDVRELQLKYGLSRGEFNDLCKLVKEEYGYSVRPIVKSKYYYRVKNGFSIRKVCDGKSVCFGSVPSRRVAVKIVELCKNMEWDVDVCREIVANWREHII